MITARYDVPHTLKYIRISPNSEWSSDHSRYTDLPRICKTATRTKPTKRVSCAPFRQLRGPPSCYQSLPHLRLLRQSQGPFPSSHMSVRQLTHSTDPKTKGLKNRTELISQIQTSDGLMSSEDGSCKFHKYRIISYPVQGVPASQKLAASMLQYSLIITITRPITPTRHARLPQVTTSPRGTKWM